MKKKNFLDRVLIFLLIVHMNLMWFMCNEKNRSRGGSRDFEKGGGLCQPPWLADEKNFGFQMSKKAKITLEKFFGEISLSIFSPFLCIMKTCR